MRHAAKKIMPDVHFWNAIRVIYPEIQGTGYKANVGILLF